MRSGAARFAALVLLLSLPAGACAGTWTHSAEYAAGYDSNLGNAGSPHDRRDSPTAYLGTQWNWEQRFGPYTALQVRTSASFEEVFSLGPLSSVRAATRVRVLHKPGRSFRTPVLGAWFSTGARDYGSRIRDGFELRTGVSAAAPLTTAVEARLEAMLSHRKATGRVFDLSSASYALNLDWIVSPGLVVYGGLRYDDGDFAVTAQGEGVISPKTEHLYLEPRASAIEADRTFGDDWWAFKIESHTVVATAGINLPLTRDWAFDAQLQHGDASMGRFRYVRDVASVGLLYRW